jgi:enterochelin esterase-like enzyme
MLDKMNAIEEVIVVGIRPNNRMNEYTQPGYEDYGRFMVETLKPLVDAKYRTLAGPINTAVMGSSLGGVVSFYLGWQWPEIFGKIACLSSTLNVSGRPAGAGFRRTRTKNPDLSRQRLAR